MKRVIYLIIISIVVVTFSGCFYDKEELVYPTIGTNTCDTTAIKYSIDVTNILSNSCNICHGGNAAAGAGIKLDNYTGVKNMVNNGILLKSITHASGASPMPKAGAKLSDCNINKIRAWINRGAPQN